jgi:hypothetical protein
VPMPLAVKLCEMKKAMFHTFITSALDWCEWSVWLSSSLAAKKRTSGTNWIWIQTHHRVSVDLTARTWVSPVLAGNRAPVAKHIAWGHSVLQTFTLRS